MHPDSHRSIHRRRCRRGLSLLAAALVSIPLLPAQDADPTAPGKVAAPPPVPEFAGARLSVPWNDLKALWEQAASARRPSQAAPPVPWVVTTSRFDVTAASAATTIEARIEGRLLAEGWHAVPLLGGEDLSVSSIESENAEVAWQDDRFVALVREPGAFRVTLRFEAPALAGGGTGPGSAVRFEPLTKAPSRMSLVDARPAPDSGSSVDGGGDGRGRGRLVVEGAQPLAGDAVPPGIPASEFRIPPGDHPVVLRVASTDDPATAGPSSWAVASTVLVRPREAVLSVKVRLFCRADDGDGRHLSLRLPERVRGVQVSGEDGPRWSLDRSSGDGPKLAIEWESTGIRDRTVELAFDLPVAPTATQWPIVPPVPEEPGTFDGATLFIEKPAGLEISGEALADPAAPPRLPAWIRQELAGQVSFAAVESRDAQPAVVDVRWLPEVETADAVVEEAVFTTRLVVDGSALTEMRLAVRHRTPHALALTMTDDARFLACRIDGEPATPRRAADTGVIVHLPAGGAGEDAVTRVEASFTERLETFDPVSGRLLLRLPQTPEFIHTLRWFVSLPPEYETTGVQGNVQLGAAEPDDGSDAHPASPPAGALVLRKDLSRGDQPTAEIHYRRRGLAD